MGTVSLCVKRVVEVEEEKWPLKHSNREVGEDKPDKAGTCFPDAKVYRGVCSNHICDMSEGDEVLITGPTGAEMLLPTDQDCNIIMLATGTGIAPMRSYMRLLFHDDVGGNPDGSRKFQGLAWLFLGVPYSNSLLYVDEHDEYLKKFPDNFRADYAVSRRAPASRRCAPTCACSSTTTSARTPTDPASSRAWRGSSSASRTRTRCSTSTSTTST